MLVGGFVLAIIGIALWSVPAALTVAGIVMFAAGGLELRRGGIPEYGRARDRRSRSGGSRIRAG